MSLKLFNSPIFGMTIVDTTNKRMYLFNKEKTKYQIAENSLMEEIYQECKGMNTINKPYCVLVYGQVFKKRNYGLNEPINITEEELMEILSDKELVCQN